MPMPPRKLPTPQEFATLSPPTQLDVLRRANSRQKLRLLLEIEDAARLVAQLPPQDLFLLARELGPDQVPELLVVATTEQWTAFFDFACWDSDRFHPRTARPWLAVMLEGEEEWLVKTLLEMDVELLVLILRHEVQVLYGPEDIAAEAERGEVLRRDGGYVIDYRDEDGARLFGPLLDVLLRHDPDYYRYLLEAIRSESDSLLEESVYQQRAGRLLDQGIPDAHAAQTVYAWLDPAGYAIGAQAKIPLVDGHFEGVPGAALQLAGPAGLLAEVLRQELDSDTTWELACLANKVLMADQVDLGDLDAVRGGVARCYDTLNLALEYLAEDDPGVARHCLEVTYVEELFRLGYSLTLRLQWRTQALLASPVGAYLDGPYRQLCDALRQRRPRCPEHLVHPGRAGMRTFAALRELRLAETWLDRLEVQRRLFAERFPFELPARGDWELSGCHPAQGRELTLSAIFLTALANRVLGRPFAPEPFPGGELATLHGMVSRQGRVDPSLREQTCDWLETLEPGGGSFGEECLELWEEGFCRIAVTNLDPRFVDGLIIAL